jgi:hypothetical protein
VGAEVVADVPKVFRCPSMEAEDELLSRTKPIVVYTLITRAWKIEAADLTHFGP